MRAKLLFLSPLLVALAIACGGDSKSPSDSSAPDSAGGAAGAAMPSDLPGNAADSPLNDPDGPAVSGPGVSGRGPGSGPQSALQGLTPPVLKVTSGSNGVAAGIGSYCWSMGCIDSTGPVTAAEPLVVAPGAPVHVGVTFDLAMWEMTALPAAGTPKVLESGELLWNFPPLGGDILDVVEASDGLTFIAPSAAGRYVVSAYLFAEAGGDVYYSILLEVK